MAFILYLLYLCSIILFLYIEVIINGEHLNNRSKRIYREFYCRRGIKTKVWCVGGDSSYQQQKVLEEPEDSLSWNWTLPIPMNYVPNSSGT